MPKTRKDRIAEKAIHLAHPDRSPPTEKTLLEIAQERSLFDQASARQAQLDASKSSSSSSSSSKTRNPSSSASTPKDHGHGDEQLLSPRTERFLEACLWTSTLAMLHFTFDVFVHNQYATKIEWPRICLNTARAWIVLFIFFYPLHPHPANPSLIPFLPLPYQHPIRQTLFFAMSSLSGCALIYVTNAKGYMYNMRRAPTLSCLWLWAVVELDLVWAVSSLAVAVAFLLKNGYRIR